MGVVGHGDDGACGGKSEKMAERAEERVGGGKWKGQSKQNMGDSKRVGGMTIKNDAATEESQAKWS